MLCLFLHLLVDICTFWLSWVMLLWTLLYKYLFMSLLSVLLGIWLGVKLLDHMVILCLTFWRTAKLVFHTTVPFSIAMHKSSNFSISLPNLFSFKKKNRYPNGCELVFPKVFFYNVLYPTIFSHKCHRTKYLFIHCFIPSWAKHIVFIQ